MSAAFPSRREELGTCLCMLASAGTGISPSSPAGSSPPGTTGSGYQGERTKFGIGVNSGELREVVALV